MEYKKIAPLGPREGTGTFDCIYDNQKYSTMKEAQAANDYVQIDFVKGEDGIIYFEFVYSKAPDIKRHQQLQIQHFPFGIDVMDDATAMNIANEILDQN